MGLATHSSILACKVPIFLPIKTLESPLNCKEIKLGNSKGNQS